MPHQSDAQLSQVGLYLSPSGQRRVAFQAASAERFARLFVADGAEQATTFLGQQAIDLLIIDLERFDRSIDLRTLGAVVALRGGAPILVICPFANACWLSDLMAYGPIDYVIGPVADGALADLVTTHLAAGAQRSLSDSTREEQALRELLAIRSRLQSALVEVDDLGRVAEQVCVELCSFPDCIHVALFHQDLNDLRMEEQYSPTGLNLVRILNRSDHLLQSPLRHAFPGLLAACTGATAFLDAPEKSGEPELAIALRERGVEMVLGLPIPVGPNGAPRGSLCLMFDQAKRFTHDELATLASIAQLAGFGLRMAAMGRENEQLLTRVTHLATTDALTGVINRRRGEELLEKEARRARRYKVPLGLIMFDIDRFRDINEQFGHPCGDMALRTVAQLTLAMLRSSDVLVRSGGEEFLVIAPHTDAIDGLKLAEKIRAMLAQADMPGCDRLTVSLGVAQLSEQESGDALTQRATAALSRAKRAGRNCVELAMQ
ncbi:MAG: GGDEF domain-containing protein [Pseudomonadota bacterium]